MSIAYKKNGVWVTASGTPPIDNALSATSENAVQNKIVKQAVDGVDSKVSKTEDLIAYVQTSLTASKNYAVGEQFVYNGLLYKATAAIAQGGTITINGNCALADNVTEQIKTLSDDTGIVTLTTGIWYRKRGNEVTVGFDGKNQTNLTDASWTNVGTLPTGCRPLYRIFAVVGLGGLLDNYGFVDIDTDGRIDIFHRAGSTLSFIWGEAVFMV